MFDSPLTTKLGWTLLQFVWQGALIAIGLKGVLLLGRRRSVTVRYRMCCAALCLQLLVPAITWWQSGATLDDPGPLILPAHWTSLALDVGGNGASPEGLTSSGEENSASRMRIGGYISLALPYVVLGWCTVGGLLIVRQVGGWMLLRTSLRSNVHPLRPEWQRFEVLKARMGIRRRVEFLESLVVEAPATIGWLRPLVLV